MKFSLCAMVTALICSSSAFAERTPLIATKLYGLTYSVISRSEKPFAIEQCDVFAGSGDLRVDINNPAFTRCDPFIFSGIGEEDDIPALFRANLDVANHGQVSGQRRYRALVGVFVLAAAGPFIKKSGISAALSIPVTWSSLKSGLPMVFAGVGAVELVKAFLVRKSDVSPLRSSDVLGSALVVLDQDNFAVARRALVRVSDDLRALRLKYR